MSASHWLAFVVGAAAGALLTLATAALWFSGNPDGGSDEHEGGV